MNLDKHIEKDTKTNWHELSVDEILRNMAKIIEEIANNAREQNSSEVPIIISCSGCKNVGLSHRCTKCPKYPGYVIWQLNKIKGD